MSRTDWACLGVFIAGFLLFLYAANKEIVELTNEQLQVNTIIGYLGIYMWFGAIIAYLIIYVYKELTKKTTVQKP
jgi:hypothetical protein